VLEGTRVIFSRLWKNDVKPHEHPLWKLATGLGAHCTTQLDEDVTHLITDTMATEKVSSAATFSSPPPTPPRGWPLHQSSLWGFF